MSSDRNLRSSSRSARNSPFSPVYFTRSAFAVGGRSAATNTWQMSMRSSPNSLAYTARSMKMVPRLHE